MTSNPAMGGLILQPTAIPGSKRKFDDPYNQNGQAYHPNKKFDFDGKYSLKRREMRVFVNACDLYKTLRLLIPSSAASEIEKNIAQLEQGDDCKIIMPPSKTYERNIFIICRKEQHNPNDGRDQYGQHIELTDYDKEAAEHLANVATRIATILKPFIEKEKFNSNMKAEECEIRLLINQNLSGRMIGKGGENIKEIRDNTGCKMTIFTETCPSSTDICVQISGKDEQVYNALVEVLLIIRGTSLAKAQGLRLFYNADKAVNEGKYGQFNNAIPLPKGSSAAAKKIAATSENLTKPAGAPIKKGPDCLFRFLIPENIGGRVIGKGGEMVDRLKLKHNVLLKSPNSTSEDRIAYIYGHENENNQTSVVNAIAELLSLLGDVLKKKSIHYGRQLKRFNTRLGQSKNDITEISALVDKSVIEEMLSNGEFDRVWKESGAQVRAYIEFFGDGENVEIKLFRKCL